MTTADEAQAAAHRAQHAARAAVQAAQDAALTPVSEAAAAQTRANWRPIQQFIEEGPDVGFEDEAGSAHDQRIN
jgi:hypothetical protein